MPTPQHWTFGDREGDFPDLAPGREGKYLYPDYVEIRLGRWQALDIISSLARQLQQSTPTLGHCSIQLAGTLKEIQPE